MSEPLAAKWQQRSRRRASWTCAVFSACVFGLITALALGVVAQVLWRLRGGNSEWEPLGPRAATASGVWVVSAKRGWGTVIYAHAFVRMSNGDETMRRSASPEGIVPAWVQMPERLEAAAGQRRFDCGFGWPFVCLRGLGGSLGGGVPRLRRDGSLFDTEDDCPWAFKPVPLGLAADMVVWGMPVLVVLGLRRWGTRYRLAHGRCAECGYSLVGLSSGSCPECGAVHGIELKS